MPSLINSWLTSELTGGRGNSICCNTHLTGEKYVLCLKWEIAMCRLFFPPPLTKKERGIRQRDIQLSDRQFLEEGGPVNVSNMIWGTERGGHTEGRTVLKAYRYQKENITKSWSLHLPVPTTSAYEQTKSTLCGFYFLLPYIKRGWWCLWMFICSFTNLGVKPSEWPRRCPGAPRSWCETRWSIFQERRYVPTDVIHMSEQFFATCDTSVYESQQQKHRLVRAMCQRLSSQPSLTPIIYLLLLCLVFIGISLKD